MLQGQFVWPVGIQISITSGMSVVSLLGFCGISADSCFGGMLAPRLKQTFHIEETVIRTIN